MADQPELSMAKLGIITNPRSQKNKTGLEEMNRLISGRPKTQHVILGSVGEIPDILSDFARQGVEVIAIAGGDGTVQAALTSLFGERPYDTPPPLAVIPRGMTNMIAGDVGLRRRGLKGLASLLQVIADDELERAIVTRPILRLENARDTKPQYGMFLGGAAIYRAIEACRTNVHPYKIQADAAAAVTLAGLLAGWLLRSGRRAEEATGEQVFSGDRITVTFDNNPPETENDLIVLATTLERLVIGSRPFWNGGEGPLRFTRIAYPPKHILRYAWRILYGKEDRKLPAESYSSRRSHRVALTMDCPFTLDGELFEPDPEKPLVLTAADEARFLRI